MKRLISQEGKAFQMILKRSDIDAVFQTDGDLSHDPKFITALAKKLEVPIIFKGRQVVALNLV